MYRGLGHLTDNTGESYACSLPVIKDEKFRISVEFEFEAMPYSETSTDGPRKIMRFEGSTDDGYDITIESVIISPPILTKVNGYLKDQIVFTLRDAVPSRDQPIRVEISLTNLDMLPEISSPILSDSETRGFDLNKTKMTFNEINYTIEMVENQRDILKKLKEEGIYGVTAKLIFDSLTTEIGGYEWLNTIILLRLATKIYITYPIIEFYSGDILVRREVLNQKNVGHLSYPLIDNHRCLDRKSISKYLNNSLSAISSLPEEINLDVFVEVLCHVRNIPTLEMKFLFLSNLLDSLTNILIDCDFYSLEQNPEFHRQNLNTVKNGLSDLSFNLEPPQIEEVSQKIATKFYFHNYKHKVKTLLEYYDIGFSSEILRKFTKNRNLIVHKFRFQSNLNFSDKKKITRELGALLDIVLLKLLNYQGSFIDQRTDECKEISSISLTE